MAHRQGQTWFSCSIYSFHSEQAEQKSSVLEHLCWRTPEYSVFQGGVDRTVTWPVPKQDGGALPACVERYLHRLIYSGVLQSAQFYLFMWLFWRTPSTLKIAKSSPPQEFHRAYIGTHPRLYFFDHGLFPLQKYSSFLLKYIRVTDLIDQNICWVNTIKLILLMTNTSCFCMGGHCLPVQFTSTVVHLWFIFPLNGPL